jgi:hypothetical protein
MTMTQSRLNSGDHARSGVALDNKGNPVELASKWSDGPTLFVLLRHFG